LHYIKNYLGAARAFEKKGSLTVIGSVSSQTGDTADDVLAAELKLVANLQICLSRQLSMQRIFPAVDLSESQSDNYEEILSLDERETEAIVRENVLEHNAAKTLISALESSENVREVRLAFKL
jgi:transcription termination factor Rho